MALDILKGDVVDAHLWAPINEIEPSALAQIKNLAAMPWAFHRVCCMPDVHAGIGCVVGSVFASQTAVSPSFVGVDIGCGCGAIKTNLNSNHLADDLKQIRHSIERGIPVGFNEHKEPLKPVTELPIWQEFSSLDEKVQNLKNKALKQCGTLGGGNHFVELCIDSNDEIWILLHSGSRNLGKTLAEIHISKAKKLIHNQNLPDPDMAVFLTNTSEMEAYRRDLWWAQRYAFENRRAMLTIIQNQLKHYFPFVTFEEPILCHHNYLAEEVHFGEKVFITRKGAIRAGQGELGIIPGSMGACSFIVEGLGNPESFESASHGAGRKMSRGEARRRFTEKDLIEQTKGVECRKDKDVIDEIPSAYKDIRQVMENQKDLVRIVAQLKQIMCIKG